MHFFGVRRARVRLEFARLYPEVPRGVWMSARKAAHLVRSTNVRKRRDVVAIGRVLSDLHFEFRGGRRTHQELTGIWTPRAEARAS